MMQESFIKKQQEKIAEKEVDYQRMLNSIKVNLIEDQKARLRRLEFQRMLMQTWAEQRQNEGMKKELNKEAYLLID